VRPLPDIEWVFAGPEDAAAYRREVARLWGGWLLGMAALMLAANWVVLLAGIGVLVAIVVFARPLQARAATIVPDDDVPEPGISAALHRSRRDRVLRELAFGEAPLRASGGGTAWVWARRIVVGLTFGAFAFVLYDLF